MEFTKWPNGWMVEWATPVKPSVINKKLKNSINDGKMELPQKKHNWAICLSQIAILLRADETQYSLQI